MHCILNGQCMWVREEGKMGGKNILMLSSCGCAVRASSSMWPRVPAMPKDFLFQLFKYFSYICSLVVFKDINLCSF